MPLADFSLTGKVGLVTGGSRGIGEAIARGFVEQGARVVIASRKQEDLDAAAKSISEDTGGTCVGWACHTGTEADIEALFAKIEAEFGRCDILVNNAATNPYFGPTLDMDMRAFDKTFEVNVRGYFMMCQRAGRMMVKQGGGSIINVASIAGFSPGAGQGAYAMTKAAVISMSKVFAKELGGDKVRVNALCPGVVETKFASKLVNTPEIYESLMKDVPLGRHAQPSEMVGLAVYLASDASSYTTGTTLVSDGGLLT
jgi:NAD(P)-dependent dehydrogenase (short-subunit alcohol dehydrogenase family)